MASSGVFTGCLYTTGPRGKKDQLTIIYSSACHLPISWKLPYQRNCVGLPMAVSQDGGNTWNKSNENPILSGEPDDIEVWGFRDPFLSEWPALDQLRGQKGLYGLVSGGVHSMGPRVFLYAVPPVDLGAWHYLGPVIDFPIRYCPSLKWGADFGANLECANVMTLEDGSGERSFLVGQMAQLLLVPGRPNSGEFALGLIEPGTLPLRADGQNDCLLMPMTRLGHDIFIKQNGLVGTA